MLPPSSTDPEVSPFGIFSKKEWIEAAKHELDGANPLEQLKKEAGDLEIFPYYDFSDRPQTHFTLPPSKNEFLGPRAWFNMPALDVRDDHKANLEAHSMLNSGADGVLFRLQSLARPEILLDKIELPLCGTILVTGNEHESFISAFSTLPKSKKYKPESIAGAIFWKSPPSEMPSIVEKFIPWSQFHCLGIMAGTGLGPADEIAELLFCAVKQLDILPETQEMKREALRSVAFSVRAGSDFFLEISKLKALRILWQQLAISYQPDYNAPVFIHVTVDPWNNQDYEPHGSMLMHSTAAMSAVLGGCDALTIEPGETETGMTSRIARNVSNILREESHLGKVADPAAGSYFLESLTNQLCAAAWKKFQLLVK